jgi:hypothetical protein
MVEDYRQNNKRAADEMAGLISAPISRSSPSYSTGRPHSGRVTLSPAQLEIARSLGISPVDYAKGVQILEQRRRDGTLQSENG